jgi:hypothetical protein
MKPRKAVTGGFGSKVTFSLDLDYPSNSASILLAVSAFSIQYPFHTSHNHFSVPRAPGVRGRTWWEREREQALKGPHGSYCLAEGVETPPIHVEMIAFDIASVPVICRGVTGEQKVKVEIVVAQGVQVPPFASI